MRLSISMLLAMVACGCSSKPVAPPIAKPPVVMVSPPIVVVPPVPGPTPSERLGSFLQTLAPLDIPETLVLGIETIPSTGYGPLYGEGATAPPEDKLHTVVIHVHDGRAEFVGELPFLAIPQENGFLYMGVASYGRDDTEAEKKRQGAKFGLDDEYGSKVYWYVASSLWRTTDRSRVDEARTKMRKLLEKDRQWGYMTGEDVNYVTSMALCSTNYNAEWTGGALAFTGHESQSLTGLSKKLPRELAKYTNDAGLLQFARDIMREREPGEEPDVSLDEPYDMFFTKVDWRKDSHVCLARRDGKVKLMGVIELPNNSARSSEWEIPVSDAPSELAENSTPRVALVDTQRVFPVPRPRDIVVSPRKTILVGEFRDGYSVYAVNSSAPLLTIPVTGRIVMAEWANGDRANTWAHVGDPPKTAAPICKCELGQLCFESKCVDTKTVFVTSTLYTGDLGGLKGADDKCRARAQIAGLDGEFKAWMSDSKTSAASRLSHANVPYVLVDGGVLAKDWNELVSGDLRMPIRLTEFGQWPATVPHPPGCGNSLVWTNTKEDGTIASKNPPCSDWTDGTSPKDPAKGAYCGQTDSESLWSAECKSDYNGCNSSFPIFCVEQ